MEMTEPESANRLALVGIIVSDADAVETVNAVLHEYGKSILGRMGLPVRERGVNAISIVVDARRRYQLADGQAGQDKRRRGESAFSKALTA